MVAHIFVLKIFDDDFRVFSNVDSALDKISEAMEDDLVADHLVSNITLSRFTLKEDGEFVFMEDLDLDELLGLDSCSSTSESDFSNLDSEDEDNDDDHEESSEVSSDESSEDVGGSE